MTTCTNTQPLLSRWLDGELEASEHAAVAAHLAACPACAGEVAAWQHVDDVLAAHEPTRDLTAAVLADLAEMADDRIPAGWWLRVAAAAAVAIGLGLAAGHRLGPALVPTTAPTTFATLAALDAHFGQTAPAGFADLIADLAPAASGRPAEGGR
jgi:anti-sigma factor RsiW